MISTSFGGRWCATVQKDPPIFEIWSFTQQEIGWKLGKRLIWRLSNLSCIYAYYYDVIINLISHFNHLSCIDYVLDHTRLFFAVFYPYPPKLFRTRINLVQNSQNWTNLCPRPKMGTAYIPSDLNTEALIWLVGGNWHQHHTFQNVFEIPRIDKVVNIPKMDQLLSFLLPK